ncbi:hypothetical protein HYH02_013387 [Chlamydomonas schloesseri]|uniref:Uncharacterized protein n=1 Tax=Chlamydomonas schloesseri TaxID=2026947 RepID=A0A835SWK9_9CHLO|nr:hypothetical protein HYH02_013387 [Chlamydomonas schloesseri]|eukprot:KAG2431253.1 hypothetical protein HYH02_013387 [Chlamydomonas schloesseri]
MVVTFPCLWNTDGTSSLCKKTMQGFHITVASAIAVLTAWLAGPLAAFTMEEGALRPIMIAITVTAVAVGALLDLITVIVLGSASFRMWESYASLDAAGIPGNHYRTEVHGLAVAVAVVSGLSIPLSPSLLMLFTRAVERYVDRRWPAGRIPHDDLSSGGKTAAEVLEEKQRRQHALAVASAPAGGGVRFSTDGAGGGGAGGGGGGAGGRSSGSGHGGAAPGAGAGTGPTQRSSRSATRGKDYRI